MTGPAEASILTDVRALLLAALCALPAAALDEDAPGTLAQRARGNIEALPEDARLELRRMFLRYRDEVARRREQGWDRGVLSDAVVEDVAEPFQPARQLEEAYALRRKEMEFVKGALAKSGPDAPDYAKLLRRREGVKEALRATKEKLSRAKGICRDWSDDIWYLLTAMRLEHWAVDDRRRSARPFHTGAVACAPAEKPTVCLAFDPWGSGAPDVFSFTAWDEHVPGGRFPNDYFLHGLPEAKR